MADRRVTVDEMADAIMDGLLEYAELATDICRHPKQKLYRKRDRVKGG